MPKRGWRFVSKSLNLPASSPEDVGVHKDFSWEKWLHFRFGIPFKSYQTCQKFHLKTDRLTQVIVCYSAGLLNVVEVPGVDRLPARHDRERVGLARQPEAG